MAGARKTCAHQLVRWGGLTARELGGELRKREYGYCRRWAVDGFFPTARQAFGEASRAT